MSGFTGYRKTNKIDFGDYVQIEMYRYHSENEFYIHKVVNSLESNVWVDVPIKCVPTETSHNQMEKVLSVIQCGVDETKVIRVREKDCKLLKRN
ncbi:hypothetical protein [Halalkalibacterium ligniniphilum]|uniref:hypothetical protein n=1 Tax=Halalkalibacterium ligniniphilum TaxID=1134413 RepID=UPI00034DEAE2|nr:hypothetical protein [Halalkalibacterium ligniniphilum]